MLIGIMSDTHDNLPRIREAVKFFNSERVELVIHCGDFVAPFILKELKELDAPLAGVFGNNDGEKKLLRERFQEMGWEIEAFLSLEREGKRIAIYHGTYPSLLDALINSNYDIVATGHTHKAYVKHVNSTIVVNPGEVCGYLTGNSTVALLNLKTMNVEIISLPSNL